MFKTKKSSIITLIVSLVVMLIAFSTLLKLVDLRIFFWMMLFALLCVVTLWMFPHHIILCMIIYACIVFIIRAIFAIVMSYKRPKVEKKFTNKKLVWSIILVCLCTFVLFSCLLKPGTDYYTEYETVKIKSETVSDFTFEYKCDDVFDGVDRVVVRKTYKDDSKSVLDCQKYKVKSGALYGYGYGYNVDETVEYKIFDKFEEHALYAKCKDADGEYILINWYNCGMSLAFLILDAGAIALLVQVIKSKKSSKPDGKTENHEEKAENHEETAETKAE